MKRLPIIVVLATILLMLMPGVSLAQAEDVPRVGSVEVVRFLSWLTANPPDWTQGAIFFALGLFGALITMYGLIGGKLPGIAAQAQLDIDRQRLKVWSEYLDEMMHNTKPDGPGVNEVQAVVNDLRDDVDRIGWRLFVLAAPFYVLLGGFFAAALAQDMLQAVTIGAGWTAFTGVLGLGTDYNARASFKDDALQRATSTTNALKASLEDIPDKQKLQASQPNVAAKIERTMKELDRVTRDISAAKGV